MRIAGWQEALVQVFDEAHGRRFIWGKHDCCQFAARCVAAITGEDKRLIFPNYIGKTSALEILMTEGGMDGLITRALGPPKPAAFAGDGDIVLMDMGQGEQPAVCRGLHSFAPGRRDLGYRPTLSARLAWTV
jgi:hypothetical protein